MAAFKTQLIGGMEGRRAELPLLSDAELRGKINEFNEFAYTNVEMAKMYIEEYVLRWLIKDAEREGEDNRALSDLSAAAFGIYLDSCDNTCMERLWDLGEERDWQAMFDAFYMIVSYEISQDKSWDWECARYIWDVARAGLGGVDGK
jgi:hypothetical protein